MSDRIRTGDRLDHNQELYQLSYAHRAHSMYREGAPADRRLHGGARFSSAESPEHRNFTGAAGLHKQAEGT